MPWATCRECGNRYDSRTFSFCPKCGGTQRAHPDAPAQAPVRNAARMRVQLGGVLLLLIGGVFLLGATSLLSNLPALEREAYGTLLEVQGSGAAGGEALVLVSRAGAPVAGAEVELALGNRTWAAITTNATGAARLALGDVVVATARIHYQGSTWERDLFAVAGSATEIRVDVATDPATTEELAGFRAFAQAATVSLLILSLLLALGGLAATLVRWPWVALAAPLPMLAIAVFLLAFGLPGFLLFAMLGVPYALVAFGRSAFRRA